MNCVVEKLKRKELDTWIDCFNYPKIWEMWIYYRVMRPKDADRMANSVDPDQTTSVGAVWSVSALIAQIYLCENLGSLQGTLHSSLVQWCCLEGHKTLFLQIKSIFSKFVPKSIIMQKEHKSLSVTDEFSVLCFWQGDSLPVGAGTCEKGTYYTGELWRLW